MQNSYMEDVAAGEVLDVSSVNMERYSNEKEPLVKKNGVIRTFDDALDTPGVGLFHVVLILVAGWALASDSVEVQCVSFVTPQLSDENANPDKPLRPTNFEKGLLDAIIFLGMMVGGYFWGSWSDVVGRRSCLITSLIFNGTFGFASALSPNYPVFLFFRFMSGVGVGGSLPVAFSYFCEFFSKRTRGPFVIVLAGFWILGSVFASLLALAIIEPLMDTIYSKWGEIHITSWRVYIMLCTFPSLSAAFCLLFLPESPSFLFTKGKIDKTVKALNRIRRLNMVSIYCYRPTRKKPLTNLELESIVVDKEEGGSVLDKIKTVGKATFKLFFSLLYVRATVVLCTIWFTFSFGYYGLLLWFPEYFKRIQKEELNATGHYIVNTSNSSQDIYIDSVYTSLAAVPATILGILTVNMLGGKIMLTSSILLCALSSFLIRVVPARERNIVILSSLFNGIATFGWNALDIITTSEIFPVHLRSTAFGIQAVFGRIGAILGNLAFGQLISLDPMIPIALVAALLLLGGLVSLILPNPPGESELQKSIKRKCHICLCWPVQKVLQIQQNSKGKD